MNSQAILGLIRGYLERSLTSNVEMSDELIEEFGELCKTAMKKRFQSGPSKDFTIRMSNIGKPVCQLRFEKAGAPRETPGYSHAMMMVFGDLIEALTYTVIRGAGIKVEEYQKPVSLKIRYDGKNLGSLSGTMDVQLYGRVYDIKSCSTFAYTTKFAPECSGSFEKLKSNDDFGYINQLYGYALGGDAKVGGFIAVNKETGEISILDAPDEKKAYKEAYEAIGKTFQALQEKVPNPVPRAFYAELETFSGKETGNKKLGGPCSWCPYKWTCWPGLILAPRALSTARTPPLVYYTHLEDKYKPHADLDQVTEGEGAEPATDSPSNAIKVPS